MHKNIQPQDRSHRLRNFYYTSFIISKKSELKNYQDIYSGIYTYMFQMTAVYTVRMRYTMETEKAREKCINDYNKLFNFFSYA